MTNEEFIRMQSMPYAGRPILHGEAGIAELTRRIESGKPQAIGKIGGTECRVLRFSERRFRPPFPERLSWRRPARILYKESGVYPVEKKTFTGFVKTYRETVGEMDVLATWFNEGEEAIIGKHAPSASLIGLYSLNCLEEAARAPWTPALSGKRVLVVTPFTDSVERQYPKLPQIWADFPFPVISDFTLETLRVPFYSYMLDQPEYPDWFSALEALQSQADKVDYDIMLVGGGAWSLPLCVHAKRRGKIGIHLGGSIQLLFGIMGKRWSEYNCALNQYMNEHWVRPTDAERPEKHKAMEDGCYW